MQLYISSGMLLENNPYSPTGKYSWNSPLNNSGKKQLHTGSLLMMLGMVTGVVIYMMGFIKQRFFFWTNIATIISEN